MELKNEKNPNYYFILDENGNYHIHCSICNQIAATIDIHNAHYNGTLEKSVNTEHMDKLVRWLHSKDISELDFRTKHNKIIQFGIDTYCEECGEVYCKKHWRTKAIFEDSGWYNYTKNVCPQGHSKIIDD